MEYPNNGGPAFPETRFCEEGGRTIPFDATPGMSLRDYFAGQALPAVLPIAGTTGAPAMAYALADAMLKERAKPVEGSSDGR